MAIIRPCVSSVWDKPAVVLLPLMYANLCQTNRNAYMSNVSSHGHLHLLAISLLAKCGWGLCVNIRWKRISLAQVSLIPKCLPCIYGISSMSLRWIAQQRRLFTSSFAPPLIGIHSLGSTIADGDLNMITQPTLIHFYLVCGFLELLTFSHFDHTEISRQIEFVRDLDGGRAHCEHFVSCQTARTHIVNLVILLNGRRVDNASIYVQWRTYHNCSRSRSRSSNI